MTRISFNDGWTVGPNVSVFSEITGGATAVKAVTLPHDAMLSMRRSAEAESGPSSGYFDGGAVIYRKSFTAPEEWRDRIIEQKVRRQGRRHAGTPSSGCMLSETFPMRTMMFSITSDVK